jgi:hypothetical protein
MRSGPCRGRARSIQGSAGSPAASAPAPPAPPVVVSCDKPSSPRESNVGALSVSVNPATGWQPRGGQVLIAVKGDSTKFAGLSFLACFGWNSAQAQGYFLTDSLKKVTWMEGFVTLRPSDQTGLLNLGVTVPPLDWSPSVFYTRWFSDVRSQGLGFVPVSDMRLIAYTKDGVLFDEVRPIGITSVPFALLVAVITLVIALTSLHRLASEPTRVIPEESRRMRWERQLKSAASLDWILTLVQKSDGRASLAAFQILLWTLVVAVGAMFVMALSGNLINLTPGLPGCLPLSMTNRRRVLSRPSLPQASRRRVWLQRRLRLRSWLQHRYPLRSWCQCRRSALLHSGVISSLIRLLERRTSVEVKCCSLPWSVPRLSSCRH